MEVKVLQNILGANEAIAKKNREHLDSHGILAINIMSSPGAGKTSLILRTIEQLKNAARIGVIEGDIASRIDADRVSREGVPAVQINTAGGCHLDANMTENALNSLPVDNIDLVLIENVGNLVCPAEFALGEHRKVMLLSVPEGDDKPYKYPLMFSLADVVLVNKIDLLPYVNFNLAAFKQAVTGLNANARIFPVSCVSGEGLAAWYSWLTGELEQLKKTRRSQ